MPKAKIENNPSIDIFFRAKESNSKTILVTGGSGYIGQVFVDSYARAHPQHKVIVITRDSNKARSRYPNISIVEADYGNQRQIEKILKNYGVSAVVHLAAGLTPQDAQDNVFKSKALFRAMEKQSVRQLVYSSSITVYEPKDNGRAFVEKDATKLSGNNNYSGSKRAVEELVLQRKNWTSMILRYGVAIGTSSDRTIGVSPKNQGILPKYMAAAYTGSVFQIPDDGSMKRDFIDVRDLASATDKALTWVNEKTSPQTIILNVGSGKPRTINALIRTLETVSQRTINVSPSNSKPSIPASFLDIGLIKMVLNWEPLIPFWQSISDAWYFYTTHGVIQTNK
jgi:UDP-glucose 4-epimerase